MGVVLLFIDGVGIGRRDPSVNPLAGVRHLLSQFDSGEGEPLPEGGAVRAVDACFGVPGRPQSATGQTAFLTGEPAPALLGRHLLGYPNAFLAELLARRSIVRRMVEAGRSATFANAYPAAYLDAIALPHRGPSAEGAVQVPPAWRRRLRPSATALAMAAAGVLLRTLEDAHAGEAVTNDIDGHTVRDRGLDAPLRSPEEAADAVLALARAHDFTLFEHSLSDDAGHARDRAMALASLDAFDRLVRRVVGERPRELHVLVCSDHGNVEDLSTRSHTLNPVPVLYFGPSPEEIRTLSTLADVGRLALRLLEVER